MIHPSTNRSVMCPNQFIIQTEYVRILCDLVVPIYFTSKHSTLSIHTEQQLGTPSHGKSGFNIPKCGHIICSHYSSSDDYTETAELDFPSFLESAGPGPSGRDSVRTLTINHHIL